ncbi:MAG: DUF4340 domain-containing protein [Verrucomicrobia bacterium]|nr:DUF4340 domain-containing protein [Verrucomicrobiota bacterium]MBT7067934.1 DUF4340 domain-containing protein [Verrucomicrobiota bacterium]MBT7702389.1 DUF4340 domain-containing protein [Verrucomicrobiota bacterium]
MKTKNLIVLLVIAVVLGGVAMWSQRSKEEPSEMIGQLVLGELPLNDIATIVVTTPSSTSRLAKANEIWVSEDAYSYPADFVRIKAAMLKLGDLKVGQVVEVEAGGRGAMKMLLPTSGPDGGTLVEMLDVSDRRVGALLIGESRKRSGGAQGQFGGTPDGQFVSPDEGKTVVLVKDNLYEFDSADDWIEKELVSVPGTDVTSVRITGPEREVLELGLADGGADLVLATLGAKEEMDSSKVNGIKSALSYLRFEAVADPALSDADLGMDRPVEFVSTTQNGEIYTVQIGAKSPDSENRYARVRVALQPVEPVAEAAPDGEQTAEEIQAAAAEKTRHAEERAKQELKVAELNKKLAPWTYLLASYKSDTMLSTRDQIVKAIEEEAPESPEAGTPETE